MFRKVFGRVEFPATTVTPSRLISGRAIAIAIAIASSCPGSQSMMSGSGLARVPSGARRGESGYGVESGIGFGVSGLTRGLYNFDLRDEIDNLRGELSEVRQRVNLLSVLVGEFQRIQDPIKTKPIKKVVEADHSTEVGKGDQQPRDAVSCSALADVVEILKRQAREDIEVQEQADDVAQITHSAILPEGETR